MKKRTSPSSELQQPYFIEDNTISVSDIILIIARNLKIILIIPSILCLTTIIYSIFIAKPVFTSTSKIMSSSGGGASQAANLAANLVLTFLQANPKQNGFILKLLKVEP